MPDDVSCELKHVALCYMILKRCVVRCISFVCGVEKHNGMYPIKTGYCTVAVVNS